MGEALGLVVREGSRLGTIEASPDGTIVGLWLGDTEGTAL